MIFILADPRLTLKLFDLWNIKVPERPRRALRHGLMTTSELVGQPEVNHAAAGSGGENEQCNQPPVDHPIRLVAKPHLHQFHDSHLHGVILNNILVLFLLFVKS